MNLSLVLIGQELTAVEVERIIAECGHEGVRELGSDVPAAGVATIARAVDDEHELVKVAYVRGWTALADESGRLPEARKVWRRESRERRATSILLLADEDVRAFAYHGAGGHERAVAVADGRIRATGDPLAIEARFALGGLQAVDLVLIAESAGIDVDHLNSHARYRLLISRRSPTSSDSRVG